MAMVIMILMVEHLGVAVQEYLGNSFVYTWLDCLSQLREISCKLFQYMQYDLHVKTVHE